MRVIPFEKNNHSFLSYGSHNIIMVVLDYRIRRYRKHGHLDMVMNRSNNIIAPKIKTQMYRRINTTLYV